MRKVNYWIFIMLIIASTPMSIYAQVDGHNSNIFTVSSPGEYLHEVGVDTTNTKAVESALMNDDDYISSEAALFLAQKGGQDYLSKIVDRFNQVDSYNLGSFAFLEALRILDYQNLTSLTLNFADSLYQKLNAKEKFLGGESLYISTVNTLFELGNYSHLNNVIELIKGESDSVNANINLIYSLREASKDMGMQSDVIKALIYVLNEFKDKEGRLAAVNLSDEFPDSKDLENSLRKAAVEDLAYEVRVRSLEKLRYDFLKGDIINLALRNLKGLGSAEKADEILSLIVNTNTPAALYQLKNLTNEHSSKEVRGLASRYYKNYWSVYFQPFTKNFEGLNGGKKFTINQSLDSLNAYTKNIASYDWLGDQGFVRELTRRLDNAARHLARGDSANTAKQIGNYKDRLKEVYEQNQKNNSPRFVTEDGYKFLTKNAEYLLTQLPEHPSNKNGGR